MRWPDNYLYSLSGEVDKNGHPHIRGNGLDNTKPDFLVHIPGTMTENLLVMEVKPDNAQLGGVEKDLTTLTAYRRFGQYRNAIYLIYGNSAEKLLKIRAIANSFASSDKGETIDLQLIQLWYQPSPGKPARPFPWEDDAG